MKTLHIPSTSTDMIYDLTIDSNRNEAKCNCEGFIGHGYCKHTRFYKQRIAKLIYGEDFVDKIIKSFNNCYDFVIDVCQEYPKCVGNYDRLDAVSDKILTSIGKHYKIETIHRAYRLAVEHEEIVEPDVVKIRKEKTDHVMHDIHKWSPSAFEGSQSLLTKGENGSELKDGPDR